MVEKKIISSASELSAIRHSIKNIILDFGGVLFDIDYNRPIQAFRKLGIPNFESLYHKANQSDLFDRLEVGEISKEFFVSQIQQLSEIELSEDDIINAWNSILIGINKERISRVHELREKYKVYLLSNTNEIHVAAFEKTVDKEMGLEYFRNAFDAIYYSNVLGLKKPNPNTFLEICNRNNLLPSETLFMDDSLQHVEGALEAGLIACYLDLTKSNFLELIKDC